jgi:hypothetical protein
MAWQAERHQAVEVEVRAALGAFDRMVQIPGHEELLADRGLAPSTSE